jgi:hypothetical protein
MLTTAASATAPATKYFQRLIMGPRPTSEKEGADIQKRKPLAAPAKISWAGSGKAAGKDNRKMALRT